MEGQTTWIIGATGGIGRALTTALKEAGHRLVLSARTGGDVQELADEMGASAHVLDATDFDATLELAKKIDSENDGLNGVVCLAGSMLLKPEHLTGFEEYRETIRQNLDAAFSVVRAGAKVMYSNGGAIVLMSSAAAGQGLKNHGAISAAKAGIEGLIRSAASTYAGRGIRVNGVAPGMVKTPMSRHIWSNDKSLEYSTSMHPLGRIGEPDDIVPAIELLLDTERSGWMTGTVLNLDGGLANVLPR